MTYNPSMLLSREELARKVLLLIESYDEYKKAYASGDKKKGSDYFSGFMELKKVISSEALSIVEYEESCKRPS